MDATGVSNAFPGPPPYYKLYRDNAPVPPPIPPAPPTEGTYMVFRQTHQVAEKPILLSEFNVPQLFSASENDRVKILKQLNRTLLFNYFELVDILIEKPDDFLQKVDQLQVIFSNMHHVLNEFRPYEARENLKKLAQMQLNQREQLIQNLTRSFSEVDSILDQCRDSLSSLPSSAQTKNTLGEQKLEKLSDSSSMDFSSAHGPSVLSDAQALEQMVAWTTNIV